MRFYISYTNRRGREYGAGTRAGDSTHVRGWDVGVKVTPRDRNGHDEFEVYLTTGSHASDSDKLLGTVKHVEDGPGRTLAVFVPYRINVHNGRVFRFEGGK